MSHAVDPCAKPGLIHPNDALPKLLEQVTPLSRTERLPINNALDHVLAEDITSSINLPPFDNSAMDGYAFRFNELSTQSAETNFTLVGTAFAGHPFDDDIPSGGCIRIMTGAQVPASLDTVQMQELTEANDNVISITAPKRTGVNVRKQGEEASIGQVILTKGTKIGAAELGVLATLGVAEVTVYSKVKVAFFSTGDELQPVGTELKAGQIYDSNRYSIQGLLTKSQVEWIDLGIIEDNPESIKQAFIEASSQADLVLTSGGVSVGDADYVKQVLNEVGEITFWRLAMKPGKPFAMGKLGDAIFCGLPGNPVASMVTFYQLVQPIINKMKNLPHSDPLKVNAKLTHAIKRKPGRVEFQRGILTRNHNGELEVSTTGAQGSGMLTSMSVANCFIHIAIDQGEINAGETVIVEPFSGALS
ncbi:molybdopterin molybdotransferase MoeA [Shewanella sp. 202IG2-18]|uniref:molybdopterin molybdotransferase MoeA n=1 Tax=Parashewanella hymeniacidonis TaxID=2807618 RepID=UPI00195F5734|nr:molybdopterin molybdotransferase MoeA [Parashewanella hymeniacidonis]MBM7071726.1 molybdopterin molybdotransferase MoeA [Parashewanella hymeniacidonis]